MEASATPLLTFLKNSHQFEVPVYQRTYSWTREECGQLWGDILRAGQAEEIAAHFLGSIVYIESGPHLISDKPPLLVIDGQQRLTSSILLLEALARHVGKAKPIAGFSAEELRYTYLLNQFKHDNKRYRLLLTQTDRTSLLAILDQKEPPADGSLRIGESFRFFEAQLKQLGTSLEFLCRGLEKLMIVDIVLSQNDDNPQLIFESMNSTGRALSQADLIRNYVLMQLPTTEQERLYQEYWRPMEVEFGQKAVDGHFDSFVRHYLTLKTGEIPTIGRVYEAFKTFTQRQVGSQCSMEDLVADLHRFAILYCKMAIRPDTEAPLGMAFRDLRELRADVSYPLLLKLYGAYDVGRLNESELIEAIRLVESYVFRRAICGIPTNSLNNTFAAITRGLDEDSYLVSIQQQFAELPSYRRFPHDDDFKHQFKERDVYHFRSRSYMLRRLENYDTKEPANVAGFTVEHIMPQNPNLPKEWREDLGEAWWSIHDKYLHTIGNLTLTGYNAEYGDRPFAEKRDMPHGFKQSSLRLNADLRDLEKWDEVQIRKRADRLANTAASVWPDVPRSPSDGDHHLRHQQVSGSDSLLIENHQHLSQHGRTRSLFDLFRRQVLELDDVVTENILKQYVAYRAETNFVDVVPQASRLRLYLNMPFDELEDPRGLSINVSDTGHWGNGDVEIDLNDENGLAYVMSLVRQSLERQLDGGIAETLL